MRRRFNRGSMLLEIVFASTISVFVIVLLVSMQIQVGRNFERAVNENTNVRTGYQAVREIRTVAQEALSATTASSGRRLTLTEPMRSGGRIVLPITPNTAQPTVFEVNYSNGTLRMTRGGVTTTLLNGIVDRTPNGATYTPFSVTQYAPGIRALHIRLCIRRTVHGQHQHFWIEETVYIRNAQ